MSDPQRRLDETTIANLRAFLVDIIAEAIGQANALQGPGSLKPGGPGLPSPTNSSTEQLLNAQQVADFLQIPVRRVYMLAQRRELPVVGFGRSKRFRRSSIETWMVQREKQARSFKSERSPDD